VDHRHASVGTIEGRDTCVESVAVLWDLAPSMAGEWGWVWHAALPHGVCTVIRRWGDLPDGGPIPGPAERALARRLSR
jgi:hypothetical protein